MTFEDAMSSLGEELGFDLPVTEGAARLAANSADGGEDPLTVEFFETPDGGGALLSCEIGEVSTVGDLMPLLAANRLFADTSGASLSVADGRIYLEQQVPLFVIGRGEGAGFVKSFVLTAHEWRNRLSGSGGDGGETVDDAQIASPGFLHV